MRMEPESAGIRVDRMRTIVVLPAPLGPRSARIVPSSTARLTLSSTRWSSNDLHTSWATIPVAADTLVMAFSLIAVWSSRREARPRHAAPRGVLSTPAPRPARSEEHTSELQSRPHLVCRLLLEKKKKQNSDHFPRKKKKKKHQ